MTKKEIMEALMLVEQVTVNYSASRRMGLSDDETERLVKKAINLAIDTLDEEYHDGWIKSIDGLPKERSNKYGEPIEYIAMIDGGKSPTVLCINDDGQWYDPAIWYHDLAATDDDIYEVVAWHPMPKYTSRY